MSVSVLVIDDSSVSRQVIVEVLEGTGFGVVEACNGLEGLKALEKHREIRLVFCDVNMPTMNGLEFLETVQNFQTPTMARIYMLTSQTRVTEIAQAKKLGASGWIVKPVNERLLTATINKVLGR